MFLYDPYDLYKTADGNSKSYIAKLIPFWKLAFWKQPTIAEDEIEISVILANKYKVKSKNFIIAIF